MLASSASSQFLFLFFLYWKLWGCIYLLVYLEPDSFLKSVFLTDLLRKKKKRKYFKKKGCHTKSNFAKRQTLMAERSPPSCPRTSEQEHFFTATFASSTVCTFGRQTWKCQSQLENGNVKSRRSSSVVSCPHVWHGLLPTRVTLESGGYLVRVSRLFGFLFHFFVPLVFSLFSHCPMQHQ